MKFHRDFEFVQIMGVFELESELYYQVLNCYGQPLKMS